MRGRGVVEGVVREGVMGGGGGGGGGCGGRRLCELCDGELLPRAERGSEVLEVDGEGGLDAAAARDDGGGLEGPLDGAEGVVERAVHLRRGEARGLEGGWARGVGQGRVGVIEGVAWWRIPAACRLNLRLSPRRACGG